MDASVYPDGSGAAAQRGQANLHDVDAPILHGAKASKSFMTAVHIVRYRTRWEVDSAFF